MTSNKTLIIIDTSKDIIFKQEYTNCDYYSLNSGLIKNKNFKNLNSSKEFHLTALRIKDKYLNFINDFSLYFQDNLSQFGFNPYYLTDVSCKRTEYLKNYDYICHILILSKIIEKNNYEMIISYNISPEVEEILNKISKIKITNIKKNNNNSQFYQVKRFLSQTIYFFKLFLIKVLFLTSNINFSKKLISNNIFFSTYPKNFNGINHIKYGEFIKKDSLFIFSFLTDNIHQKFNIIKFFKYIKNINSLFNKNFIISDKYIYFSDLLYFIKLNLYLIKFSKNKFKEHKINNINFSSIIRIEIENSLYKLTRILTIKKSYERVSNLIQNNSKIYFYLFEYPFGRMLCHSFSQKNNNLIGFQHGPSGYLKMICYLSSKESKYLKKFNLIPRKIISEDNQSLQIYKNGNYEKLTIMNKIYRLNYLSKILINKTIEDNHLIACGLHDGIMLINYLKNKIKKNTNIKYLLKLHPKAKNDEIIKLYNKINLKNFVIANKNIEYYFQYINKVYFSYSSVGNEAEILGIKTEVIFSYYKLNESIYCTEDKL